MMQNQQPTPQARHELADGGPPPSNASSRSVAEEQTDRDYRLTADDRDMLAIDAPTHQYAMTIMVPVRESELADLRTCLAAMSDSCTAQMRGETVPEGLPSIAFAEIRSLHYARFKLIDASPEDGDPALLVLSTNFDGPLGKAQRNLEGARELHLAELVEVAYAGLDRVFGHCEGYPADASAETLLAFLAAEQHQVAAQTFYVGGSGRSRGQIIAEWKLRQAVESAADRVSARRPRVEEPDLVRSLVIDELRRSGMELPKSFPPQPPQRAKLILAALVVPVLLTSPILLLGHLYLRYRESRDPSDTPKFDAATTRHTQFASTGENLFMQNQLTHIVAMKPGWFRLAVIKLVFFVLQLLATYHYNRGKLGNIPSIHFARWLFLGKRRRVLFFSNFDNSWQSYLGDFIDQASSGLTAVWSNTQGYPPTKNLVQAGSRNSARFLAWTRAHQLPTDVWYSAYPALSIKNVNANTVIRRGLADPSSVPACTWLRTLAGEDLDPPGKQEQFESARPDTPLPVSDIQGIILRGYGFLEHASYCLFRIDDPASARTWLSGLALTPGHAASRGAHPVEKHPELCFVNVAFTYEGLAALQLDPELLEQFSLEFKEGSHTPERARILGDTDGNAPEHWEWGGPGNPVHLLLMVYAASDGQLAKMRAQHVEAAERHGLGFVTETNAGRLPGRKEHFGFRDGIAQPRLRDNPLDADREPVSKFNVLAPGEFLLGFANGYRVANETDPQANIAHAPTSSDGFEFGRAGSYLVFRQLEQDVPAFWNYCQHAAADARVDMSAEQVASKMVGRWPNGEPLSVAAEGPEHPSVESDMDGFGYTNVGSDGTHDQHGHKCPFSAHIRRSNPRDWFTGDEPVESMRLSNLHRIIRRGRPYGPPFTPDLSVEGMLRAAENGDSAADEARGLAFICFNANIERQFEFIQQQWVNNAQMVALAGDADPIMGRQRRSQTGIGASEPAFTIQRDPLRSRCPALAEFVRVRGSGYFFMPSISAVRQLAETPAARES